MARTAKPKKPKVKKKKFAELTVEELTALIPQVVQSLLCCVTCQRPLIRTVDTAKYGKGWWTCPMMHGRLQSDRYFFEVLGTKIAEINQRDETERPVEMLRVQKILKRILVLQYEKAR